MTYLLDSNILVHYLRNANFAKKLDEKYEMFSSNNNTVTSIVTEAEVKAIAVKNGWGSSKKAQLEILIRRFVIVPIQSQDIVKKYIEIDAYSQGKLNLNPLPLGMSARNMGKNDIWIAATASVLSATLLTTDLDYNHLDGKFLTVGLINPTDFL